VNSIRPRLTTVSANAQETGPNLYRGEATPAGLDALEVAATWVAQHGVDGLELQTDEIANKKGYFPFDLQGAHAEFLRDIVAQARSLADDPQRMAALRQGIQASEAAQAAQQQEQQQARPHLTVVPPLS